MTTSTVTVFGSTALFDREFGGRKLAKIGRKPALLVYREVHFVTVYEGTTFEFYATIDQLREHADFGEATVWLGIKGRGFEDDCVDRWHVKRDRFGTGLALDPAVVAPVRVAWARVRAVALELPIDRLPAKVLAGAASSANVMVAS